MPLNIIWMFSDSESDDVIITIVLYTLKRSRIAGIFRLEMDSANINEKYRRIKTRRLPFHYSNKP